MRTLEVWIDFGIDEHGRPVAARQVGTLVEDSPRVAFEYATSFLDNPLPLSPLHLRPRRGLFRHDDRDFDGLPGIFADALPDGFGRLIQDRNFERRGMHRQRVTPLDRVALLGSAAIGALSFVPSLQHDDAPDIVWPLELDRIAQQGERLLEGSAEEVMDELRLAGGSPAGARPKILAAVHPDGRIAAYPSTNSGEVGAPPLPVGFVHYLVKFAARDDVVAYGNDAGAVEHAYATMATAAGIDMPPTRLFRDHSGVQWFGAERFDRHGLLGRGRRHLLTVGGLLHASHRIPSLDYEQVLRATMQLTRDLRAVAQMYRRMVFNVFSHNRDDHARNFAFLMNAAGEWHVSPAYDLTFSAGPGGHHTTSVAGESLAPTRAALKRVARSAGLEPKRAHQIIDHVDEAVSSWPQIAQSFDIAPAIVQRVDRSLRDCRTTAIT